MCGISGFFDPRASFLSKEADYKYILQKMNHTITHRGPDGNGIFLSNTCGLTHSRLSIIDLETGSQPMTKEYQGAKCHIVYNGEIYNYKELKKELSDRGHKFSTTSDTEVILTGFLEYGASFVNKLNGIFSFAIYDEIHETCYLFRDFFGVKPLFYTVHNGTLLFGSELKAIFTFPGIRAILDKNGINEIFGLGPARSVGNGIFLGMKEVKPGCYLTINKYGVKETVYFRLESKPHEDNYEKTLEKTSYLIENAIKKQLVSDVPVCTFLSGGVDSSLVSSVAARELKKHGEKLHTFSFDFTNNHDYFKANAFQPSEDRPYVDKMVEYLDSKHHYLECDSKTQADLLLSSVIAHDLPCMADIDSSLLYFCGEVAKTHKVVLTGECADEVFGGYPWFHKPEFLESDTFPWTPSLTPRQSLLKKEVLDTLQMEDYVQNAYYHSISEIDILPTDNHTESNRRQIAYLNIRYFMQTLLNRMDRTSMNSGLEARVPFADKELVSYVFNVPWEMKAKDGVVKNLLRQSSEHLLPQEILYRKKSPYPKTYNPSYEKLLIERLVAVLDGNSPLLSILDEKNVRTFLHNPKDYGAPWYGQLMAGPQMIAYLLQIDFWLKKYRISVHL
ncbi:MAG: asparagine synthase (glutamine-hydrolyzing) [Lachnospiraceae bacterium]|nr:asparagine synthase (glutamine-hydrolyzing) [Lachnospiraceae bacterium]